MQALAGKKTYIVAAVGALVAFGHLLGWIDNATYETLLGLLGFGGMAALRAGVTKTGA